MENAPEAFVDTSAFIALADRSDVRHATFRRLFSAPPPLVTTSLVIAEGYGWFMRRFDTVRALQFMAMLEVMPSLTIVPAGPAEQAAAVEILLRHVERQLTLTDAVSLMVMEQRGCAVCWTVDERMAVGDVPLLLHRREGIQARRTRT